MIFNLKLSTDFTHLVYIANNQNWEYFTQHLSRETNLKAVVSIPITSQETNLATGLLGFTNQFKISDPFLERGFYQKLVQLHPVSIAVSVIS